jgi:hypothetical protein
LSLQVLEVLRRASIGESKALAQRAESGVAARLSAA